MTNRFGIYLHIPFCVHRCSYCDFYTLTEQTRATFSAYAEKLCEEIAASKAWLEGKGEVPKVSSIFVGGGTPTLLPLEELKKIFSEVTRHFTLREGCEVTIEANPETVNLDLAKGLLNETPVNRVSLGAQSFSPRHLNTLERLCPVSAIESAVSHLRSAGLSNLNLDLIFGIPGQTKEELLFDIEKVTALGVDHVSFYSLTLKPGHTLYQSLPSEDVQADFYEAGVQRLAELGFARYEVSNFCKPGRESSHNLLYWDGSDYLGLGPSAAGRVFSEGAFHHRKNTPDLQKYLATNEFSFTPSEITTREQTILEATFLEMRKAKGVMLDEFYSRYQFDLTGGKHFPLFVREGLLNHSQGRLWLSSKGMLLADRVSADLLD